MHPFPVRAYPYIPASELAGCACNLGENWYAKGERNMYGLDGFLDKPLFTLPLIKTNVTVKRAIVAGGVIGLIYYMTRP